MKKHKLKIQQQGEDNSSSSSNNTDNKSNDSQASLMDDIGFVEESIKKLKSKLLQNLNLEKTTKKATKRKLPDEVDVHDSTSGVESRGK